jgi:hypothetical protein
MAEHIFAQKRGVRHSMPGAGRPLDQVTNALKYGGNAVRDRDPQ